MTKKWQNNDEDDDKFHHIFYLLMTPNIPKILQTLLTLPLVALSSPLNCFAGSANKK